LYWTETGGDLGIVSNLLSVQGTTSSRRAAIYADQSQTPWQTVQFTVGLCAAGACPPNKTPPAGGGVPRPPARERNTGNSRSVSMEIRPITGSPAAADVAADLRALADLVENDGDGFAAALVARLINSSDAWPAHTASHKDEYQRAEIMAETIRRFKPIATSPIRKQYRDGGDGYLDVTVPLRALSLEFTDLRASVCERVVTKVETITEEIPDPDYIAAAPTRTVTREVETVEWKCAPVLAAGQSAEVNG
uniref:hypothetical protein n=1 Tax=Nocardia abscessus TaxID=120957 RepID=UPI002453D605